MYVPAPGRTAGARAPAAAPMLALIAALSGSGAWAQTAPPAGGSPVFPIVRQSDCAPQFSVGGIVVSGCTTLESPAGNQPYCLLAAPRNGAKLGLCSLDSVRPRFGKAQDGTAQPCDASTPVPDRGGAVFGCFAANAAGNQLLCNSGARGLLPCFVADAPPPTRDEDGPPATGAPPLAPPLAPPPAAPPEAAPRPRGGLSTAGVALVVAAGTLVSLAALAAVVYRRKRRRQFAAAREGFAPEKRFEAAASSAKKSEPRFEAEVVAAAPADDAPADDAPADDAPAGGAGPAKAYRTSSQFGYQSSAPVPDGKSAASTPAPAAAAGSPAARAPRSLGKFVIASTYTPTLNDEITIQPGDIVEVYQEDRARGVFPMHCIDKDMGRLDD
ncbi:MAG: hypothetical protein BJ554DRAFT_6799 [Olpidium bornovanus]|uniref:SH3 domain-containing protein n=1 Tax=Olpidium bornovanus TaxID=278681 RepID=A0A8H7ZX21_9FUNG|nr:MAG: hypothetical protein BJ554DRAFT_6799 [Olpidium bornovanus]